MAKDKIEQEPIVKAEMTDEELQAEIKRRQQEAVVECKRLVEEAEKLTGVRVIAQAHAPTRPQLGQPVQVGGVIVFQYDPSVREELKNKAEVKT